jgi:hypothetical protein
VHCTVDLPGKDCIIERPDENPLPANLVQRYTMIRIALCGDDDLLYPNAHCRELPADRIGLRERELAAPCANFYRHDRYAMMIFSMSASECAADRKFVSNCEGGMKIPAASIFVQNRWNAPVSHSLTS